MSEGLDDARVEGADLGGGEWAGDGKKMGET